MTDPDEQAVVTVATASVAETEAVAETLARVLPAGGVTVGLSGPLGAGKTSFTRGLAAGLGVDTSLVASPTFLYLTDYPGRGRIVHHADLYRLLELSGADAAAAYESIGLSAVLDGDSVCVVEWWDHYQGPAPAALVRVEFTIENAEHRRLFVVFQTSDCERAAETFRAELLASGLTTAG
jgi:tRNA threonylcarbamoyladenosine biosynthesis protein TsaE